MCSAVSMRVALLGPGPRVWRPGPRCASAGFPTTGRVGTRPGSRPGRASGRGGDELVQPGVAGLEQGSVEHHRRGAEAARALADQLRVVRGLREVPGDLLGVGVAAHAGLEARAGAEPLAEVDDLVDGPAGPALVGLRGVEADVQVGE